MGTGRKMGASLQKGFKKFVNGYRAKTGNVFAQRCEEIRQWVKSERNSSMGKSEIVNRIYDKNDRFYDNLR